MRKDKNFESKVEEMLFPYEGYYNILSTSNLGLKPADIILFNYNGSSRIGIVVASKRTSTGIFLSTRANTLLNVFLIDQLSSSLFKLVVDNLYNQEVRCTYSRAPKVLSSFLKKQNFRTFNTNEMVDTRKVIINVIKYKDEDNDANDLNELQE
jgi:hypothetical protein